MNLLYIANIRLPTEKAHGLQIMETCAALTRQGASVELLVPTRRNSIHESPFEYYDITDTFKIHSLPTPDLIWMGPMGFWMQSRLFAMRARRYVRSNAPDALYSRDEKILAWISPRCPFIWESHEGNWNAAVRAIVPTACRIAVTSERLQKLYVSKGVAESKIRVIPHGIKLADFIIETPRAHIRKELHLPEDRVIISHVGKYTTMGKSKGLEEVFIATALLRKTHPEAFLLIVGPDQGEIPHIQALLEGLKVGREDYMLVSHVPHARVPAYLHASDLLMLNYPGTHHYAEIMSPLKLLEYMASGTPIISSDLPSIRELLKENMAFYTPLDDPAAYANTLAMAIENPEQARSKALAAREEAQKFTWDERARKILQAFSG